MSRTPQQQSALDMIYAADQKWRQGKTSAEAQIRNEVEKRVTMLKIERDDAVMHGLTTGLSKAIIGRQGLSTTDPAAVNKVIAVKAPQILDQEEQIYAAGPYQWVDRETQVARVNFIGYPGEINSPEWSGILKGLVARTPETKTGWTVIADPTDQKTEFGILPGFLRVELDAGKDPLLHGLNSWAEATS